MTSALTPPQRGGAAKLRANDRLSVDFDTLEVIDDVDLPSITVVLVSFHDEARMTEAVERLLAMPCVTQVVVVRNESDLKDAKLNTEGGERYLEIKSPINLGFGRGFNLALPYLRSDVMLSLNADVEITQEVIERMSLRASTSDAIVAPSLYNYAGGNETGRRFYSLPTLLLSRSPWRRSILPMPAGEVDWAIGGCLAIKTSLFKKLRGFDDRFFLYFEDVDLCWRAREQGWPTVVMTDRAYHAHARSSSRFNRTLWWHIESAITFFKAHPRAIFGLRPVRKPTRQTADY